MDDNRKKALAAALGHEDWARLRVGVGSAASPSDLIEHVLGPFGAEEEENMGPVLDRALEAIGGFVEGGSLETLMARCNRAIDVAHGSGGAGVQEQSK